MVPMKFRKSSRCEELNQDGCVEVANGNGGVFVRDSTCPSGPVLRISREEWRRLVNAMEAGRLQ
jgi:hypothetical protein